MHSTLYAQVFAVQTSHWWGRNRRRLSLDLLRRFGLGAGCRHLDFGCGTGQNLRLLEGLRPSFTVGADLSPIALEFARKAYPDCRLVRLDANRTLPFPENCFDVVTIFNVLYHAWIVSDLNVLKEIERVLTPEGVLLITEPAFQVLAREVDIADMAERRYRLQPFVEMLRAAGFDVLFANYFTSFGAVLIFLMKAFKTLVHRPANADDPPDMRSLPSFLNEALFRLAQAEAALVRASAPMPFGTTIICLAQPRGVAVVNEPSGTQRRSG